MLADPCRDLPQACYPGVTCTKVTDTEFECGACPRGHSGDGRSKDGCQPVNECADFAPCFPGASCEDHLEGFECGDCPVGYTGPGLRAYDIQDAFLRQHVSRKTVQTWKV